MRRRAVVAVLACLALAGACGGRVSREQVAAEAAEDGVLGVAGGVAAGPAGSRTAANRTGSALSSGATAAGSTAVDGGGDAAGAPADGGTGPVAPQQPEGGNGGATDVGVTEDRIVVGNVATLSGPVPGLFRGALVGAQAWAAMVNSQGGIDGRLIEIRSGDDALDSGRNKAAVLGMKDEVFAFVGSFSVTDDGGATELAGTNIPDIGVPLAVNRYQLPNNFAVAPTQPGWETGPARYYIANHGAGVVAKTAQFVAAVETARVQARRQRQVFEGLGYQVVYSREIQPNEPNYTGDVIQMRSQGVQSVLFEGQVDQIADLVNTMRDQGFEVPLLNLGSTAYSNAFLAQAGEAAEGARIDVSHALYLGGDLDVPEVALFREWMERVDPDQDVDLFALYAWASGRLLEQALREAGPAVTRDGVLAALSTITSFDANGLVAPANPAGKQATSCFVVVRIEGGEFVREHPARGFDCDTGAFQPLPG